jgi:ferric-dicitrate binding protein FerR (iron transport regulator)
MTDASKRAVMSESGDEDGMARLLRLAGPRRPVPADRTARVRAAVHREWQTRVQQRSSRRRALTTAALLAAAVLVLVVARTRLLDEPATPAVGNVVAVVQRTEGEPRYVYPDMPQPGASPGRVSTHDSVRTGTWIETDARARVALRLMDGTSVRIDTGSRARLISSRMLELTAGSVYVDTGRETAGFEVITPLGTARDVGTQFEVRLGERTLRLRVRTGHVDLRHGPHAVSARAGTEVTMAAEGPVSQQISASGPEWDWAVSLAPPLEIEGVPLAAFLERLSREQGWTLRYADRTLAAEASGIVLHGSVAGLHPREALDVAVRTSGLVHRLRDGELVVSRPAAKRSTGPPKGGHYRSPKEY